MSDQGSLTSPTLTALLRGAVAAACPTLDVRGLDKVALLEAVRDAHGWAAVVGLGQAIRELRAHAVVRALVGAADPAAVVERWMRLERFGHSRNRTELRARAVDGARVALTVRHVASDGGPIVAVNDLFIWGLLVALVEAAGATEVEAALVDERGARCVLHGPGRDPRAALPAVTHTLVLRARAGAGPVPAPDDDAANPLGRRLAALLEGDLLRPWTVASAARALAMSTRSLQRGLRGEATSFSRVVLRTRIARAQALLAGSTMSLTEIAFCVGFADQAHFTRVFRRFSDVPPSALRELLEARRP